MTQRYFLSIVLALFGITGCSITGHPQLYGPPHFQEDGWYVFEHFRYRGELAGGQPNGSGTIIYSNDVVATGTFYNGVLHGDNVVIEVPSTGTYRGTAQNGALTGGEVHFENGTYYRGELDGFQVTGRGVAVTSSGNIYTGTFRSGTLSGRGSLYSDTDGKTVVGDFEEGRPQGEVVVRDEKTGRREVRVYEGGQDVTDEVVDRNAKRELEREEQAEIKALDTTIETIEKEATETERKYTTEKRKVEENTSDMENGCYCEFNACLTTTPVDYSPYTRNYQGKERTVYAPYDASESEVMARIRRDVAHREACLEWARNPEAFDENRFREIEQQYGTSLKRLRAEREQALAEKRRTLERQERERQRRLREKREAEERRIRARAEKKAKELEEQCARNANACGCIPPERLLACRADKTTSCACNW